VAVLGNMRILIVNLHLDIGGVETLLVRLIPQLARRNVSVTLLILQNRVNQEFLKVLEPYCSVRIIDEAFPFTKNKIRNIIGPEPDVAFFTISQAVVFGSWLLSRAEYGTKIILGAYQTEIFCAESSSWQYHRNLIKKIIRKRIPSEFVIFGNSAGRDFHATRLGADFDASPIIRLFVDVEKYEFKERANLIRNEIISIGRISPYKTYNFTVLSVVKKLVDSGRMIEWHIYGNGEEYKKLQETIEKMELSGVVHLHGEMAYSKFQTVLDNSFLFIGSGTSLIEAAACGVPALTTIEYAAEPDSYGFISEIEGYNLIEPSLDKRIYSIEKKIEQALDADEISYIGLQRRCYEKAMSYSGESVVDEYISTFQSAKKLGVHIPISNFQLVAYCVSAALNVFFKKIGFSV
jgi:glycosyltransferase involved in cell wall biosynthesis